MNALTTHNLEDVYNSVGFHREGNNKLNSSTLRTVIAKHTDQKTNVHVLFETYYTTGNYLSSMRLHVREQLLHYVYFNGTRDNTNSDSLYRK
jgi:hypothetical protein